MLLCYIALAILLVFNLRYSRNGFNDNYLSFETTNSIKVIFILLVFIKHIIPYILNAGYIFPDSICSRIFVLLNSFVGQWIVVMFLFYSGYGVMESIKKKGMDYVVSIPRKRVLSTMINFDVAVLVFVVISLFAPVNYSVSHYILSFIGWENIGNSSWYIFVIVLCYLIAFLSFRNRTNSNSKNAMYCILLLMISILVLYFVKQFWWYDTMICFGVGMLYSLYKEILEQFLKKYYWTILVVLVALIVSLRLGQSLCYPCLSILNNALFGILVVLLTMKFQVNNPI